MSLTPKQLAFCREYLVDMNATQAAIRAGYSRKTASSQGERLLRNVEVRDKVLALIAERSERTEITADRVLGELARLALYDPGEIGTAKITCPEDIEKLPEDLRRAIVGWAWDRTGNFVVKLAAKTQPLDLLGQHLGLWKNKFEITGKDGSQLIPDGPPKPSPEEVAAFAKEVHEGFTGYRHEATGDAANFGAREIESIASNIAEFAAGTFQSRTTATAKECGEIVARVHCVRRGIMAEAEDKGIRRI